MPQKKNPDVAELIRGKSGRLFGNLMALLTVLKGCAHVQPRSSGGQGARVRLRGHREGEPGGAGGHAAGAARAPGPHACGSNAGFTLATELADYLSTKGVPFRDAHGIVGQVVRHCLANELRLEDLAPSSCSGSLRCSARTCGTG